MRRGNFAGWYPAGYEYKRELLGVLLLLGCGLIGSLSFFEELYREVLSLYYYVDGERFLQSGKTAASFTRLAGRYWMMWIPVMLFLLAMPLYHYFYYYRETRSIYLMRRLPERGALCKSCVLGPLVSAGAVLTAVLLVYLLYFGIYLLCVPASMGRFV